jgi:hypothetical protein
MTASARCESCGQLCAMDDAWTVRGRCAACIEASRRAERERSAGEQTGWDFGEPPMVGQTTLEGLS